MFMLMYNYAMENETTLFRISLLIHTCICTMHLQFFPKTCFVCGITKASAVQHTLMLLL